MEKMWYELPIRVNAINSPFTTVVYNGENGGRIYPPRHYWPDHEDQQKALAELQQTLGDK
jgi:hypothetical protein